MSRARKTVSPFSLDRLIWALIYWGLLATLLFVGAWSAFFGYVILTCLFTFALLLLLYGGFIEPRRIFTRIFSVELSETSGKPSLNPSPVEGRGSTGLYGLIRAGGQEVQNPILDKGGGRGWISPDARRLRIVFLADLHAGASKGVSFYERVVSRVETLKPDVVILGGDLVDWYARDVKDLACLTNIVAPEGKYFVLGGHDFFDDPDVVTSAMESYGFTNATNRLFQLTAQNKQVDHIGLDDSWFGAPDLLLLRVPKERLRILVTHQADILMDIPQGVADLVLLGHTHGGQVRLPWVGAVLPLPHRAPQWLDEGKKMWQETPVIISRGLGEACSRVRFFAPPEIVCVDVTV
jgi:hypothetical protein